MQPGFPAFQGVKGTAPLENQYIFNFNYALTLEFENVHGPFHIAVENEEITQASLAASGRLAAFPDSVCVPIADGSSMCVVFHFSGDTTPNGPSDLVRTRGTATGPDTSVGWTTPTRITPARSVRVVHARGDDCAPPATCTPNGLDVFDTDITFGPVLRRLSTSLDVPHSPPGLNSQMTRRSPAPTTTSEHYRRSPTTPFRSRDQWRCSAAASRRSGTAASARSTSASNARERRTTGHRSPSS